MYALPTGNCGPCLKEGTARLSGAAAVQHRNSHSFLAYWDSLRGDAALPDRKDFNPDQIRHLVGHTLILDVNEPAAPKYLYAGPDLCKLYGRDLSGCNFFSGWDRDSMEAISGILKRAGEAKRPICMTSIGRAEESAPVQIETVLALFLSGDGCLFIGHQQKLSDQRTLTDRPLTSQRLTACRLILETDDHLLFRPKQHLPTRALMPA